MDFAWSSLAGLKGRERTNTHRVSFSSLRDPFRKQTQSIQEERESLLLFLCAAPQPQPLLKGEFRGWGLDSCVIDSNPIPLSAKVRLQKPAWESYDVGCSAGNGRHSSGSSSCMGQLPLVCVS